MMKPGAIAVAVLFAVSAAAWSAPRSRLADLQKSLRGPAKRVAAKISGKICVLDLTESGDERATSEFGLVAADMISGELVRRVTRGTRVVERRELVKIFKDSMIFGDPGQIDRLIKEVGMEVLVSGTYAASGAEIVVTLKAVKAADGTVLAAEMVRVRRDASLDKMLLHRFKSSGAAQAQDSGDPADGGGESMEMEAGVYFEGGDARLYPVREGMVLTARDNYAVLVKPEKDCHLYVYQVDGNGDVQRLFPNPKMNTAQNPLRAGKEYWLPNDSEFFFLDDKRGRETLYLVASRGPAPLLDGLKAGSHADLRNSIRTMGAGGVRTSDAIRKVRTSHSGEIEVVAKRIQARGDFFLSLSFLHQ